MNELGGKTGVLVGLDLHSADGGTKAGVWSPTSGQLSESEEKQIRLTVKQLICGSLNGMRIRQSLLQPYMPQIGTQVPWKAQHLGAGVQVLWSNPRARTAVDCRETDWGDEREEIVVGDAGGGKPCNPGSKVILLSHTQRAEPSLLLSPLTRQHWQLNSRETGPSNACRTELQSRTPPRVLL